MLIAPLTSTHHGALIEFFERPDQGFCFCRFWYFAGATEAWLACDPTENRRATRASLEAGEVWGLVALEAERVVGWMRLARSAEVPKLDDPTEGAASILCVSVAEEERGKGLARALVRAAIDEARALGCAELRAYPRFEQELDAGAVWTGPRGLFESEGFTKVRGGERRWTFSRAL